MDTSATFSLLESPNWHDYELLDTGEGLKLERFGPYTFIRPEVQAMWKKCLPVKEWEKAHAIFQPTNEESGGHWVFKKKVEDRWEMHYDLAPGAPSKQSSGAPDKKEQIRFWAMTTPGRHLGFFPETAAQWEFILEAIRLKNVQTPMKVLNLFGYTGLASLTSALAGAQVTHVDASKKSVTWARENQSLSKLEDKPIRWIVDDALKFVEREGRRGVKYDGILLDPPKFGRGPKGEVWEIYQSLPEILFACRKLLNESSLFVILTVYAVKLPAIHAYTALADTLQGLGGSLECGELVTQEKSAGRLLSQAVYARWQAG